MAPTAWYRGIINWIAFAFRLLGSWSHGGRQYHLTASQGGLVEKGSKHFVSGPLIFQLSGPEKGVVIFGVKQCRAFVKAHVTTKSGHLSLRLYAQRPTRVTLKFNLKRW